MANNDTGNYLDGDRGNWDILIDVAAEAAATADGWVWKNMDKIKRGHWRFIMSRALNAVDEWKIKNGEFL